jgi:hypothetical protein
MMTDHDRKMAAWERVRALAHPRPGDTYTHRKGGEYRVVAVACMEDTHEPMVVYRSMTYGTMQVRTLANWAEDVEGRPRFVLVEPAPDPLARSLRAIDAGE